MDVWNHSPVKEAYRASIRVASNERLANDRAEVGRSTGRLDCLMPVSTQQSYCHSLPSTQATLLLYICTYINIPSYIHIAHESLSPCLSMATWRDRHSAALSTCPSSLPGLDALLVSRPSPFAQITLPSFRTVLSHLDHRAVGSHDTRLSSTW